MGNPGLGQSSSSNLAEIASALSEFTHILDLDRPGPGVSPASGAKGSGTLADEIFDVDVRGIQRRSIRGQYGASHERWPPNEPRYARRKGYKPISILTGEMMSDMEVGGERSYAASDAEMRFGTKQETRDRAGWFELGTRRQPERPFYDSSAEDDAEKVRIVDKQIDLNLGKLG